MLHELQLNAWVLAARRSLGPSLVTWDGETHIEPPPKARQGQLRLHEDWSAEELRDPRARPVRPDAILEVESDHATSRRRFLVEYDRTRRVDKNYDKFRRYDTFLCSWWRHAPLADSEQPPFVLFICQDEDQRSQFLNTADRELTGHRWHPSASPEQHDHVGRRRILFAIEREAHNGVLQAWRLPAYPPGHPARRPEVRRVAIAPLRGEPSKIPDIDTRRRAMLDALISGTTDPETLADLARGQLRKKLPALREALEGRFSAKHAPIVGQILAHIDFLDEAIDRLSEAIEEQLGPFGNRQVELLASESVQPYQ